VGVADDGDEPRDPEGQVELHLKGADPGAVHEHIDVGAVAGRDAVGRQREDLLAARDVPGAARGSGEVGVLSPSAGRHVEDVQAEERVDDSRQFTLYGLSGRGGQGARSAEECTGCPAAVERADERVGRAGVLPAEQEGADRGGLCRGSRGHGFTSVEALVTRIRVGF
jgi:hypothetical protein